MAKSEHELEVVALIAAISEASHKYLERCQQLSKAAGKVVAELDGVASKAKQIGQRCTEADAAVDAARADEYAKLRAGIDRMMETPEGSSIYEWPPETVREMAEHARAHKAARAALAGALREREYTEAEAGTEAARLIDTTGQSMERLQAVAVESVAGINAVLGLRRKLEGLQIGEKGAT